MVSESGDLQDCTAIAMILTPSLALVVLGFMSSRLANLEALASVNRSLSHAGGNVMAPLPQAVLPFFA